MVELPMLLAGGVKVRIITGRYKGLTLHTVPGLQTRPTQDRVREALFSILGDVVDGASVLDLYAGTGSLGLEALSRGGASAVFVENSSQPLKVLRQNISKVDESLCRVFSAPVARAIPRLAKDGAKFDLIFMDPPYRKKLVEKTLGLLNAHSIFSPRSRIIAEHESRARLPAEIGPMFRIDSRTYGDTAITLYSILEV